MTKSPVHWKQEKHGISFDLTSMKLYAVLHNTLIDKLMKYRPCKRRARQAENCLNFWLKGLWVVIKRPAGCWSLEVEPMVLGHCLKSGKKQTAHDAECFSGSTKFGITVPKPWQYSKYNFTSKTSFKMKLCRFQCSNSWQKLTIFK